MKRRTARMISPAAERIRVSMRETLRRNRELKESTALAVLEPPPGALEVFPDTARHKCRFTVASESSGSIYMVSFDSAPGAGYWTCSCRGCVGHGQCKHLTAMGLRGRKFGKDLAALRQLRLSGVGG